MQQFKTARKYDAPPVPPPPVQWAHLSAAQRATAINDDLRIRINELQSLAWHARSERQTEVALQWETRAAALGALSHLPADLAALAPLLAAVAAWRALPDSLRASLCVRLLERAADDRAAALALVGDDPPEGESAEGDDHDRAAWMREQARGLEMLAAMGRAGGQ